MKSTVRHYAPVAVLLAVLLAIAAGLSLPTGEQADRRPRVVTTTYPLYVAAQNILSTSDTLALEKLSATGAGCLHNYQLSPGDRLVLEQAELVLTNGIGPEPFLEGVSLRRVVNTGAQVALLDCDHQHQGEDHHHHHNEHVWVSPERYADQVLAVLEALVALDGENAALYRSNAENYLRHIDQLWSRMQQLSLAGRPCVLFQDSLAYLAEDLGLAVKATLAIDGDSGIAAGDLAAVERLARQYPDLLLLYDTQYPIRYGGVDGLVPADQVLALETAVVGDGSPGDWLDATRRNLEQLEKLTGGDKP